LINANYLNLYFFHNLVSKIVLEKVTSFCINRTILHSVYQFLYQMLLYEKFLKYILVLHKVGV